MAGDTAGGRWSEVPWAGLLVLIVAGFCFAMTWHDPGFFWRDDAQTWSVPLLVDLHRSLAAGEWPWLSPYTRDCTSLIGEYQPGVCSPMVVLGAICAVSWGGSLPGIATLYAGWLLAWTALGAYALARLEGLLPPLALLVAIVAAFNGFSIGWGATNWHPAQAGFAALLWLWAALVLLMRAPWSSGRIAACAAAVALLLTAGGPHLVLMGVLVTALLVGRALLLGGRAAPLGAAAAAWGLGSGLAAPAWLPFLAFLGGSVRAAEPQVWSWLCTVPFSALSGLALPTLAVPGFVLCAGALQLPLELANGLVPTAVVLAALACGRRGGLKGITWPLGLAVGFFVLSTLPSFGFFRWSFRWLPLAHTALALAAALWLQGRWQTARQGSMSWRDQPALWGLLALGAVQLVAAQTPVVPATFAGEVAVLVAAWGLSERAARAGASWARAVPALVALGVLGLTYRQIPPGLTVPTWPFPRDGAHSPALDPARRYLAVMDRPAYYVEGPAARRYGWLALPGNLPMVAGIEFVNGYSPNGPPGTRRAFSLGWSGFMATEAMARVLERDLAPGGLLARIGVDGVVFGRPNEAVVGRFRAHGWRLIEEGAEGAVFHRDGPPSALIRSVVAVRAVPLGEEAAWSAALAAVDGRPAVAGPPPLVELAAREARVVEAHRNQIVMEVRPGPRPALLGVMRGWAPRWVATLDGRPVPVLVLDGMVPGVIVPAGVGGRVVLSFEPVGLTAGFGLAGSTLVLGLACLGYVGRRRRDQEADPARVA